MTEFERFIKVNNLKKKDIAEYLGVSAAFITQLTQGVRDIPSDKFALIKANNNWNSEMLNDDGVLKTTFLPIKSEEVYFVPLLPIAAQGGSLNDFIVSVKDSDCERVVSPIKGADFAITVSGDSMAPEFPNGSQILIKKINERAFIDWGKTYVLDTCNGTVIKTLVPSESKGYVKCISINPDPKYAAFEVAFEDIYGVYRVMMCMSVK